MTTTEPDVPPKDHCSACKSELPPGAKLCKACGTYQGGLRKYIPFSQTVLALVTALIGVTSPALLVILFLLNSCSHTSLMATKIDTEKLSTYAWNTGHKPGRLMSVTVDFGPHPIENVALEPIDPTKTLIPGGSIESPVNGVVVEFRMPSTLYERAEGEKPHAKSPSLIVEIEESTERRHTVTVPLNRSEVDAVVEEEVALMKVVKK